MDTQLKTEIEWFEVGDVMPDDETAVLIYIPEDDEVWIGHREIDEDGETEWYHSNRHEIDEVSHWAHLPEAPKEKAKCGDCDDIGWYIDYSNPIIGVNEDLVSKQSNRSKNN